MAHTSTEHYLRGDLQQAFASLAQVPEPIRDPRFLTYRAALLLAVGRVDEARQDLEHATRLDANASDALALQSIIAVVQDAKDQALTIAQQAVQQDQTSATARIALSYAQQARFDLSGARTSLEKAVQLDPKNALAWARFAELLSSEGKLSQALQAAKRAVALEPGISRTHTVLGFAYLQQVKTLEASAAFAKAIVLDQADPLPRLGLGLAKIRDGRATAGSRDIETAASLDPNNALIRSYLGKAYFEDKRVKLDEREYRTAKTLDPNDPTPWFYDAIQKQTNNRPVEALRDAQQAIALNDHRAVYRSRLLLDADLAARSAGLARIYSDLGFQQLALVEGWKSVNTDPSNFSAHRFLADSYAILPRHQIARVSELLQSQLLQPTNLTPIQPRLAESNLFLISAGGPGALSFNEFNPLFNRDRLALQLGGLFGEDDTRAGEGVLSGIYKKLSFSLGYSHFKTDGFRQNNDQDDDIANAFLQLELTPQTSLQFEYRYWGTDKGDLQLRFFPDQVHLTERRTDDAHLYRLGARHAFGPGSILLGSLVYRDAQGHLTDQGPFPVPVLQSIGIQQTTRALGAELQHLFRTGAFHLSTGVGHVDVDARDITTTTFAIPLPPPPVGPDPVQPIDRSLKQTNVYAYSHISVLKELLFTVGFSTDILSSDNPNVESITQFNPKFGVTWSPVPTTTLRAGVFRVLKRPLITDQTLEPTQVAGLNQFFDDANGTKAWRYGGAIDQQITQELFAGLEISRRDLEVPFQDVSTPTPVLRMVDWKEYLGRAYLFWTPHPWVALRAEYLYEHFDREKAFTFGIRELDTSRVPLGVHLFHPSGVSARLTTTYVHQRGDFEPNLPGTFVTGKDDFWLVDLALNYRLPKRYGFIALGVNNLFDQKFRYEDTDPNNPSIQPARSFFSRITLALP